ncbi:MULTISPECIES: murein biosynthesis integral membrane protein MurJ [Paraclostridium]|uniref:Probable lipid II flippase MurJ n=3 Tax=Clostridia TaxID=186801 RepID=T4VLN6_PARBF|nr:murein biosynthesis integral membrane protein MurJ [Paraclostridium bifermentans]EQK42050.1 integral membrane protein MviN [[Clostridium] bifermentans ATCC 638] [Paraclostridium bifermentans ATCC 638 = DSM 14991]RIZ58810.1 lipid II flippase MurJ [Paraclostridium bifermentans]UAG18917.1 murein biosynthesis integral membrane protein MurJ [Paraclostridium bifermentans]WGX76948.1 murein biosynthesis integral membrane protein MurJ [Paraclostridium bifermentans]
MSKVAKAAVGLMAATLIAKILGFGRELALASAYGASGTSDAFLVAMNIPAVIFSAIGTSLGTAFIPLYCDLEAKQGKKASLRFSNNVLNIVVLLCLITSLVGVVFTEPIVKLFAVGFKGETLTQAIYFTRVLILGMAFLGMSYIMMAFLQVKENFVIPGLMSVPYNMLIIISIFLSVTINPNLLPWGTLIGLSLQFIFQYPFARKKGFKYRPYINLKDEYLKRMLWLIGPVLIGVAVTQVNSIVDRTIASTLVEGSISALNYATKLNQFVMGMFIVSISSVIYPMLSKLSTENNKKKFKESIVTAINVVTLIIIPISVGAIILAEPIVKLLFQRGEFDARATQMTAIALIFYSIGMLGFGLRDILGKIFYSLQDTKTPMINGIIAMVLNIVLNLAFVKYTNMGLGGLAFATSISSLVTIALLSVSLRRKIGAFGGKKIISVLIKSIIAALLMALVTKFTYNVIDAFLSAGFIQDAIKLAISVGLGAIVYAVSIIVLRVDEVKLIFKMINKKVKRK